MIKYLNKIVQEIKLNEEYYNTEGKDVLIILIEQILAIEIGEEKAKEIVKILKGGDKGMLNCIESAYRENRVLLKTGMEKGSLKTKTEIIKNMLKENLPIDLISKITGISQKEINKMK